MIGLASVECLLHALAQVHIVNEVQNVDGAADVVQLPERFFGIVLPGIAAELANDGGLGGVLLRQRRHDALDVGPFTDDQFFIYPVGRSDQHFSRILAWKTEANQ